MPKNEPGVRCPICGGGVRLQEGVGSVPDLYVCLDSQRCQWSGMVPEKGAAKIPVAPPAPVPEKKKPDPPARETTKEAPLAKAADDPRTLRLWQLNTRRKRKGLPRFDSLDEAIKSGDYKPHKPRKPRAPPPDNARPAIVEVSGQIATVREARALLAPQTVRELVLDEIMGAIKLMTNTHTFLKSFPVLEA